MAPFRAIVVRDGKTVIINTDDIVHGDYVLLTSGDRIPVDIRMSAAQDLLAVESLNTVTCCPVHCCSPPVNLRAPVSRPPPPPTTVSSLRRPLARLV
jgi:hypothetical protein